MVTKGSEMIQKVTVIAAMMVTTVERLKAALWTVLMAFCLRAMKRDHHNEQVEATLL